METPFHILLMGKPRSGKTTLLKKIISHLDNCGGFYTEEILKDNQRIGFKIKTLDGKEAILAHQDIKSKFHLGRYGINLKDLEEVAVKAVEEAKEKKKIIIIDEIGPMELASQRFKEAVIKTFSSGKRVVGVIHRKQTEFLNTLKRRKDIVLFEVSLDNQQEILKKIF
ncbi:MAG: NTPase [Candidatus Omnitrophica bacterium]|nr:NTPase [Candidatus Omnitrophota bacterium]